MVEFLSGLNAMASAVIGLFFLRFWRQTFDLFFALFSVAFWVLSANWLLLALTSRRHEALPVLYGMRLMAFVLIMAAIVYKNGMKARARQKRPGRRPDDFAR
jgi:hypothetical protein